MVRGSALSAQSHGWKCVRLRPPNDVRRQARPCSQEVAFEGIDNVGIEVRSAGLLDAIKSFLGRDGLVVRALRSHGVECVCKCKDAPFDGTVLALQAIRVSLAVPSFVMAANPWKEIAQIEDWSQDALADFDVHLDVAVF